MDNKLVTILLDSDILFDLSCHNYTLAEAALEIAKLLTPKLQWKSEEITGYGGDSLILTKYELLNSDLNVYINDRPEEECDVWWDEDYLISGTLDECKQFCSDKILNDFLKLCE